MKALIFKEIKDFWSNGFGIFSLAVLLFLLFLFLWVFPESSYPGYGLAESDLYFEFIALLYLFVIPAISVGFLTNEYKYGTDEVLRSLGLKWRELILSKFIAAFVMVILITLLTSVHLFVVDQFSMSLNGLPIQQVIGSYIGLLGIACVYISISLLVASWVEQTIAAFIIAVILSFFVYQGFSMISGLPAFYGGWDIWLEQLSLSFHTDQISRGVLRLSTIVYVVSLSAWCLWVASFRMKTKEV